MVFALPESFVSYATEKDIRSAVDHILNSKALEVPSDLGWAQLPDFHAAVLGAHQVQCEYASAIQNLWNKVWQGPLETSGLDLEAQSLGKTSETLDGSRFDPKSVWDGGSFGRGFGLNAFMVCLGVSLDEHQARLWISLTTQGDDWRSDTATLVRSTEDWCIEEEVEEYGYTARDIARVVEGRVELDRLSAAAKRALDAAKELRPDSSTPP